MKRTKDEFGFYMMSNFKTVRAIRNGFVTVIPLIMLGSFALIIKSLQIGVYQEFINHFLFGIIYQCANFMYQATFGLLSVYITVAVSSHYEAELEPRGEGITGAVLTSVACFSLLAGVQSESFQVSALGVKGMFTALLCALLATRLYLFVKNRFFFKAKVYSDGTDAQFNTALATIFPGAVVLLLFAMINFALIKGFHVNGFHELFVNSMNAIFEHVKSQMGSGILFVLLSSLLWFFGIHGSDVLEGVMEVQFTPNLALNQMAVEAGQRAPEILTKQFFDCFILLGGCGSALCLLIAIFLCSKRGSNRKLAKVASLPMLFNINEIMVFGLPIIFNPVMLIPFLLTPCVIYGISYLAMWMNIVPVPIHEIEWTTPILLSGYLVTGSIRGSLLQLVNLLTGVLIYMPFVKIYDKVKARNADEMVNRLVLALQQAERENQEISLLTIRGELGAAAKTLAMELKEAMKEHALKMYYQPQFDPEKKCIGAEALLRWNHPLYGMIYPPLIIRLAQEADFLMELETYIFKMTLSDREELPEELKQSQKICINVSADTLRREAFIEFLGKIKEDYKVENNMVCIEITEQTALFMGENINTTLAEIKDMGYQMAIDDFSMGHTSIKYLQGGYFDLVKLDGSLVRGIQTNERNSNIIESIVHLSQSLGFSVLAEYVETEEQQKILSQIGCTKYQGYLFCPAVSFEKYVDICRKC